MYVIRIPITQCTYIPHLEKVYTWFALATCVKKGAWDDITREIEKRIFQINLQTVIRLDFDSLDRSNRSE